MLTTYWSFRRINLNQLRARSFVPNNHLLKVHYFNNNATTEKDYFMKILLIELHWKLMFWKWIRKYFVGVFIECQLVPANEVVIDFLLKMLLLLVLYLCILYVCVGDWILAAKSYGLNNQFFDFFTIYLHIFFLSILVIKKSPISNLVEYKLQTSIFPCNNLIYTIGFYMQKNCSIHF